MEWWFRIKNSELGIQKGNWEFVKIDNQSMIRRYYKHYAPVGQVARQIHNAMEASVGQHFDNQMINCMGMANENSVNLFPF